jgi:S-adenosylmethionine decarboxylase proenzyme
MIIKALGRHLLVEFYNCNPSKINEENFVEKAMNDAAREANATIVQSTFHSFTPHGVSGVVVIAESHLAIHTWPEYGYCAVDLFTCGDSVDPWVAFEYLRKEFEASNYDTHETARGDMAKVKKELEKGK